MDLIDRQAAIDAVESAKTARTPDGEIYVAKLNAEMNIHILPSIDAVPVVRCKDCNHYDDGLCRRWIYAHVTNEDSFCSGAERKEE